MADTMSVRVDSDLKDAAESVDGEHPTAGLRELARDGARKRGLVDGHTPQTGLRSMVRMVGAWFIMAAVAWVGLTYFYPIAWRLPAIALVISGGFCYALDRVLARYEPAVSRRLRLRGDKA